MSAPQANRALQRLNSVISEMIVSKPKSTIISMRVSQVNKSNHVLAGGISKQPAVNYFRYHLMQSQC